MTPLPSHLADAVKKEAERQADLYDVSARESKAFEAGASFLYSIQPGWVRVEDQMPEHSKGVLVYIPVEDHHITSGMWDIDNKWVLLDEYRVVGEGEGMENCKVTHWMPLPQKPLI